MKKRILYIGRDETFKKSLVKFFEFFYPDAEIDLVPPSEHVLLQSVLAKPPQLVYLDELNLNPTFLSDLVLLKGSPALRSVCVVALFKELTDLHSVRQVLSSGLQLVFIKGGDVDIFLKDSVYVAFEERCRMLKFARASDLRIKLKLGTVASITRASPSRLTVEGDVCPDPHTLVLSGIPFGDQKVLPFKILDHEEIDGGMFPMTERFELQYPVPGPWDESTVESVQQDTIDTWLALGDDDRPERCQSVLVVSKDATILEGVQDKAHRFDFIFKENLEQSTTSEILSRSPGLLVIDVGTFIDVTVLDGFFQRVLRNSDYSPLVVLLGTPTTTDAFRKLLKYEKLIAAQNGLTASLLQSLIQKLPSPKGPSVSRIFHKDEPARAVEILVDVELTSLSEHEFTFLSLVQIPLFSIVRLELPIPMFATVIPPLEDLQRWGEKIPYMAIIHALSDDEYAKLRKIVNQLIYHPVQTLTPENVLTMIQQSSPVPTSETPSASQSIFWKETREKNPPSEAEAPLKRRNPNQLKSKL